MKPADTIVSLYDRLAVEWEADRGRAGPGRLGPGSDPFERPWLDRFAGLLPDGGSILDIGCGSGDPIARYFLNHGYHVDGVDSSPRLVDICRAKFPDRTWIAGDMRTLDLGRVFDGLIAWHSLFHVPPDDQPAVLAALSRHARSGTALMFTSGTEHGEHIGQWRGEPLYHASLSTGEYHDLLAQHGFQIIDRVENDATCGGANIWLTRKS